jgi:glycosyltransferase involved in cell wall biosynthesis
MNILFIGPYRQADGWGEAARSTIEALTYTGHNITIRPIFMGVRILSNLDQKFIDLENNLYTNYDVVIQNVLPHLVDYDRRFNKNVILVHTETSNLEYTSWPYRMNLMDEVWVTTNYGRKSLLASNVKVPIKVICQSVDTSKFLKSYEPIDLGSANNKFKFYFIGENITRKGLMELVAAYSSAFCSYDNVFLLIKTSGQRGDVENLIKNVRQSLAMYANDALYPEIGIITDFVTDDFINRLHYTCDCFVMPSYGEATCIPAMEAMGFGNTPIVTDGIGPTDYITEENGYLVKSTEDVVLTTNRPLADLYTGYETWRTPNTLSLKYKMIEAYEAVDNRLVKSALCKKAILELSHEKVGKHLETLL